MARNSKFTRYGEPTVGAFDLDESGSEFISDRSHQSIAARDDFLPEDPIPLFLSGHPEETQQPGLGKAWETAAIASRILRAGILAVLAAAIGFALLSVENPLALFANAKASLIGVSPGQASATPAKSTPEPVNAERSASAGPSAPTRDEIAAALRTAHESQTEIRQPPAAAAPPARRIDADEVAALLKRARSLIAIGDIAPARLLLERAADAQEASAALLLAQTYDPAVLGTPDARSITPDPATARGWYQKAARFGSQMAQQRLDQMQN
jgi:TPR repeat protein